MPKRIKPKAEPTIERGTLKETEFHPAARAALDWLATVPTEEMLRLMRSIEMAAAQGIRSAEICEETWRRLMCNAPVSDRYLLGLCWPLRDMCDILEIKILPPYLQKYESNKRGDNSPRTRKNKRNAPVSPRKRSTKDGNAGAKNNSKARGKGRT